MNRKIRFRGKRTDNGEWAKGYYYRGPSSNEIWDITSYIVELDEEEKYYKSVYEVDPETVGQFTGLKDMSGVEIYEGDILKHHGQVAWNDVEHRWSAIDLNWNDRREWHDIDYLTSEFEVIGNIHE